MTPFGMMMAWMRLAETSMALGMSSAEVIAQRTGQMMTGSMTPREAERMVSEKSEAMLRSAEAATRAVMRGASPQAVAEAALRPMARKAASNARRLRK